MSDYKIRHIRRLKTQISKTLAADEDLIGDTVNVYFQKNFIGQIGTILKEKYNLFSRRSSLVHVERKPLYGS